MTTTAAFFPGTYSFVADSGFPYVMRVGVEGPVSCSCLGFRGAGICKHIEDVELFGDLPYSDPSEILAAMKNLKEIRNTNKKGNNKMGKATTTRKVVVRRTKVQESAPAPSRRRRHSIPMGVRGNLKVAGERTMRKGVTLAQHPTDPTLVRVLTGSRGRPSHVAVSDVENFRVL